MQVFITLNNHVAQSDEAKRAIRSQAMRDFRRRQKEERLAGEAKSKSSPTDRRTPPPSTAKALAARRRRRDSPAYDVPPLSHSDQLSEEELYESGSGSSIYGDGASPTSSSSSGRTESIVDDGGGSPLTALGRINDRSIERVQMFADFFESHLPFAGPAESTRARYISYLANVPSLDMSSVLVSSAVDALCFAHVGSKSADQRLVRASQASYGRVLSAIRHMLSFSSAQCPRSREVVISIMLCALFEDTAPVRQRSAESTYMTHLWGAQQYIGCVKPSRFDLSQPLDRAVVQNVFQASFWLALARRTELSFKTDEWKQARFSTWPSRSWYHVYELIPGLLERTDKVLSQRYADPQELLELCDELEDVKENIHTSREPELAKKPAMRVQLENQDAFDTQIEEQAFMLSSSTFTSFPKFQDPESGVNHQSLGMVYLIIDCTLLRIFHFRPVAQALSRRAPEDIEREAHDLARKLCETVYYFSTLSSLAYADTIKLAVELARSYFVQQNSSPEIDWCQRCLIATNARIIRLRTLRPATLCRVGYLPPGLTAAGRYRSEQLTDTSPRAWKISLDRRE